jgi:large subunit ribosomal protein L9
MQVILLQDVDKLGLRGEVVDVARGYARNFLLPRRLAETATPGALEELRRRDELRARQEASSHDEAREIATRLEGAVLRFDVKAGPTGTLFGSVTATDIADRLWTDQRIRIDRRKVGLGDSIKRVGRHEVPLELFTDVEATLNLEVVPEGGVEEMEAMVAAAKAEEEAAAAAAAAEAAAAEPEGAIEADAVWVEEVEAIEAEEAAEAAEGEETAEPAAEAAAEPVAEDAPPDDAEAPAEPDQAADR